MARHPIRIIGPRDPPPQGDGTVVIDTTSRSRTWSQGLSPFLVGPCPLYRGAGQDDPLALDYATCLENLWQYAKVYPVHVGADGKPNADYWRWARAGWANPQGQRYPMGKGAVPAFTWWAGEALGYVEARARVYVPAYAQAVLKSAAWPILLDHARRGPITLWDFDPFDYEAMGMTFAQAVNHEPVKLGHSAVLKRLLELALEREDA